MINQIKAIKFIYQAVEKMASSLYHRLYVAVETAKKKNARKYDMEATSHHERIVAEKKRYEGTVKKLDTERKALENIL